MKYKHPEADIRNDIIKEFNKRDIKIKRIENSICGRHKSIPDLWFFDPLTKKAGWIEVKSATGRLSNNPYKDSQEEFRDLCQLCNTPYWIVRSVDEAMYATGRREYDKNRVEAMEFKL
jgi:hypothetical protein